jgi:hypothetical protein
MRRGASRRRHGVGVAAAGADFNSPGGCSISTSWFGSTAASAPPTLGDGCRVSQPHLHLFDREQQLPDWGQGRSVGIFRSSCTLPHWGRAADAALALKCVTGQGLSKGAQRGDSGCFRVPPPDTWSRPSGVTSTDWQRSALSGTEEHSTPLGA